MSGNEVGHLRCCLCLIVGVGCGVKAGLPILNLGEVTVRIFVHGFPCCVGCMHMLFTSSEHMYTPTVSVLRVEFESEDPLHIQQGVLLV